jgi:D-beta-D-heptose 7-phosphate kinase/D-beta-D-heptose 1-phosphate adenosyltransferase
VVAVEDETFLLGGAAYVVNNIHSLEGEVCLCGVIGDDEMGQKIAKVMSEKGIGTQGVFTEQGRQTTVKTRIIAHQQQVVRIDREATGPVQRSTFKHLDRFLRGRMEEVDGIILSDYGKGLLTGALIRTVVRKAREAKKFVMVDPKLKNFFSYKRATVVTPNTAEAGAALGTSITDGASLKKVGEALLKRLKCDALVITRGEEGMTIFEPDREPVRVPTIAKEVYDVTGAGDTVIGTMALALGAGAGIVEAAKLANYAAGIVVAKVGTATVNRAELLKLLEERIFR